MKNFKVIREVKPRVRTIEEIKSDKPTQTKKSSSDIKTNSEFIEDTPISSSRSSPTLDIIEQAESVEDQTRFFQRSERDKGDREREENTRFYESTQRKENRMEYTTSEIVGQVGEASARAASTAGDLLDRSSLQRSSGRADALDSGHVQQDRNYELTDKNDTMHVKRRKELY